MKFSKTALLTVLVVLATTQNVSCFTSILSQQTSASLMSATSSLSMVASKEAMDIGTELNSADNENNDLVNGGRNRKRTQQVRNVLFFIVCALPIKNDNNRRMMIVFI